MRDKDLDYPRLELDAIDGIYALYKERKRIITLKEYTDYLISHDKDGLDDLIDEATDDCISKSKFGNLLFIDKNIYYIRDILKIAALLRCFDVKNRYFSKNKLYIHEGIFKGSTLLIIDPTNVHDVNLKEFLPINNLEFVMRSDGIRLWIGIMFKIDYRSKRTGRQFTGTKCLCAGLGHSFETILSGDHEAPYIKVVHTGIDGFNLFD